MRSRWFSLLFLALFGLWLAPAHAALKFGTSENIRFVANITVPGPDGEKLYLGRKITQKSFLLPYSIQDDGYVIGAARLRLRPRRRLAQAPRPHSSYSGPAIALPMRLYPRRLKTLGLLVFCIAAVAGGLFMAREQPLIGYLCAGFFAPGIPVMLINLLPGQAYLELAEDGFTFAGVFRKNTIYWKDVAGFGVASISGNKMVGWDFVPEYAPQKTGRAVSSTLTGVQGALPDTYGMKAEQLSALMNELKRRSMGSPDDAAHG